LIGRLAERLLCLEQAARALPRNPKYQSSANSLATQTRRKILELQRVN
jgi:hypothetical protein